MKTLIIFIITLLILISPIYFILSFIQLEWNPLEWRLLSRIAFSFWIILMFILTVSAMIKLDYEKNGR